MTGARTEREVVKNFRKAVEGCAHLARVGCDGVSMTYADARTLLALLDRRDRVCVGWRVRWTVDGASFRYGGTYDEARDEFVYRRRLGQRPKLYSVWRPIRARKGKAGNG